MGTQGNNNETNRRAAGGHAFDWELKCRDCGADHHEQFDKKCTWVPPSVIESALGNQSADVTGVLNGEAVR